jgi:small subunit ribosomal protein S1
MSDQNENSLLGAEKNNDTVEQGESFASLLEKKDISGDWLQPGQKVKSTVIKVAEDFIYIDIGGKTEGVINSKEFRGDDWTLQVKEGDEIEAFFVSVQDGLKRLTTMVHGYPALKLSSIRSAFNAGVPVSGEIKREVKGGFEVFVGGVRCFCPFSQIDLKGGREGGIYLGQTFPFKVIEFKEGGRNIVLSRRILLEEEKKAQLQMLRETLSEGSEVTGRVHSIHNFGAFVDLGGIDGLIPVSEMSWGRTEKPEDVVSLGQEMRAKVISLDWNNRRITLSLKAMQPDPWESVAEKYPVDGRVAGPIVRLVPFGAFVNLEPGIDGLIHISNIGAGRRINHPKEVMEVGQWVEAYVLEADPRKKKVSLSIKAKAEPEKAAPPSEGAILEGIVEKVMPFGVFVRLDNGFTGLIPNGEMDTPKGTDHARVFPEGTRLQAIMIGSDEKTGKIRLSRKGITEKAEEKEFERYKESLKQEKKSSGTFGSIGDLLKAKMDEKGIRV